MLEAKFQKAESDLNHLSRKLELRCQDQAAGDNRRNPLELLRKVNAVKDEYKALVQEAAEIQKAQVEAMEYFRSQIPIAMQALQQLQYQVGMGGSEADKAKVEELQSLLGIQTVEVVNPSERTAGDGTQLSSETAVTVSVEERGDDSQETECEESKSAAAVPTAVCEFVEDPVESRAALRSQSQEWVGVSQEELESVSELIRGRVKLGDVNVVYRSLYRHFKEEGNSQALTPSDMHKLGMRVSGATGQAKLKVLRALKLLTISSKGDVKLL
ncbi:SKA complex subunit 2-like [Babylonia areolata]|uniref:SKA complex subunit 2-like n=1 Tax=Babylonia areolata TaxID=304850 RepID=UPI003FD3C406